MKSSLRTNHRLVKRLRRLGGMGLTLHGYRGDRLEKEGDQEERDEWAKGG